MNTLKIQKDAVVSREGLKVVRLRVPAGLSVPEHHANVDVVATVVRGKGTFVVAGERHAIEVGSVIDMAPFVRHAVEAEEDLELVVVHARLGAGAAEPACGAEK